MEDVSLPGTPGPIVTEEMIWSRDWTRRQGPFYRVEELAKLFFGMSASWLRLKMKPDEKHPETWFVINGKRMEFSRNDPAKTDSARVFTLADVEPMARSLFSFGAIKEDRLGQILAVVRDTALLYRLLPGEEAPGQEPGPE